MGRFKPYKDLACEEDLDLGLGQVTQIRFNRSITLNRISIVKVVTAPEELRVLATDKFKVAILLYNSSFYFYNQSSVGPDDGDNFISAVGGGFWEKRSFSGSGGVVDENNLPTRDFSSSINNVLTPCSDSSSGSIVITSMPNTYTGDWEAV